MKKLAITGVGIVCILCLLLVQWKLTQAFSTNQGRIEVLAAQGPGQEYTDFITLLTQEFAVEEQDGYLVITAKNAPLNSLSRQKIEHAARLSKIDSVTINDLYDADQIVAQQFQLTILVLEIVFFITAVGFLVKSIKAIIVKCKQMLEQSYWIEILDANSIAIFCMIIAMTILLFVMTYVLMDLIQFRLYISPSAIPPVYIFDIGHYMQLMGQEKLVPISAYGLAYEKTYALSWAVIAASFMLSLGVATMLLKGGRHGKSAAKGN